MKGQFRRCWKAVVPNVPRAVRLACLHIADGSIVALFLCIDCSYDVMLKCWALQAKDRPDFELVFQDLIGGAAEDFEAKKTLKRSAKRRGEKISKRKGV